VLRRGIAPCFIAIEHHQAVMAHADWIIDLGPGAGHDGGRIALSERSRLSPAAPRTRLPPPDQIRQKNCHTEERILFLYVTTHSFGGSGITDTR
jgi:hypothetical protein